MNQSKMEGGLFSSPININREMMWPLSQKPWTPLPKMLKGGMRKDGNKGERLKENCILFKMGNQNGTQNSRRGHIHL